MLSKPERARVLAPTLSSPKRRRRVGVGQQPCMEPEPLRRGPECPRELFEWQEPTYALLIDPAKPGGQDFCSE